MALKQILWLIVRIFGYKKIAIDHSKDGTWKMTAYHYKGKLYIWKFEELNEKPR